MSETVLWDGCGKPGQRPRMHPSPKDWLYLEAKDAGSGDTVIVWACSTHCASKQWRPGPGPRFTAEEMERIAATEAEGVDSSRG